MIDVDGLKAVNDTYGHQVGDAVLVAIAGALSRDNAIVGRYGGDEFVVVLPNAHHATPSAVNRAVCVAQVNLRSEGARLGAALLAIDPLVGEV